MPEAIKPLVVLLAPSDKWEEFARGIISPKDRRKFGKSEDRRIAYFTGRAALRKALEHRGVKAFVVPDREYGYLKIEAEGWYGNISHTLGLVAAVVARSPVGIDVESASRDASRVMKRVATDKERAEWKSPIQLWSAKEAFSKAFGLGMKFGFQGFEVDWSESRPWRGRTNIRGPLHVNEPRVWQENEKDFLITVVAEAAILKNGIELIRVDS